MAGSALIDDLLRQFAENPRRVFARLANEYRKAGEYDQAIEICRAHIPQHPGYISGHIVLGQALYDSGRYDEAKATFEVALGLDPENMIAIRQLGDIARVTGDAAAARRWYQRLLEADPQNDEISSLLAGLEPASAPAGPSGAAPSSAEPLAAHEAPSRAAATGEAPATGVPELSAQQPSAAGAAASPASDAVAEHEPIDIEVEGLELIPQAGQESAHAGGIERSVEWRHDVRGQAPPVEHGPLGASTEAPDPHASDPHTAALHAGDQGAPAAGASGQAGYAEPTLASPTAGGAAGDEPASPAAPSTPDPAPDETTWDTIMGRTVEMSDLGQVAAAPQAFVTETMAELYLQQGYTQEALDLYRQLAAQNPNDQALRQRVAQLEHGARSSVSVAEVSDAVFDAAHKRHTARPTKTIRTFFGRLAARRIVPRATEGAAGDAAGGGGDELRAGSPGESDTPPLGPRGDDPTRAMPFRDRGASGDPEATALRAAAEPAGRVRASGVAAHAAKPFDFRGPAPSAAARRPKRAEPPPLEEQLFPGALVSAEDESAAVTLAGAFTDDVQDDTGVVPGEPGGAGAAELSLDDVFRDEQPVPPSRASAASDRDDAGGGAARAGEGAPEREGDTPAGSDADQEDVGRSGDLENFNAWLEGLKK